MSIPNSTQMHDSDSLDIDNNSDSVFSERRETSISTNNTSSPVSSDQDESNTKPSTTENAIPINSSTSTSKPKTSHNVIEKKYRTNINTKFLDLKNAVPTLRILDTVDPMNFDDLEGLTPAPRLNKANILSKAAEYIKHLESKNKFLLNEIHLLKLNADQNPIQQQNQLFHSHPYQIQQQQQHYHQNHHHIQQQQQQQQSLESNSDHALLYQQLKYQNSLASVYPESFTSSNESTPSPRYGYQSEMPNIYESQASHRSSSLLQNQNQRIEQDNELLPTDYNQSNSPYQPIRDFHQNHDLYNPNQNPFQNPYEYQSQENNSRSLANKIMVGGIATLVGTSFTENSSEYRSFGAMPMFFIDKSVKLIQLITLCSCFYYFSIPFLQPFLKRQKDNKTESKSLYSTLLFSVLTLILDSESSATNETKSLCPIDLASFPISFHDLLLTYMNISKINTKSLSNPIAHTFNKIVLADFILKKFPVFGNMLGLKSKIEKLTNQLITDKNNCKITEFVKLDPNFINSPAVVDELSKIIISLKITKSTKVTADQLYGDINSGSGYSSINEYLHNTPINKINLFELVTVLWCVDTLRLKMLTFLNDIVNDEKSNTSLVSEIHKIKNFIPTSCIKLIKCSMIFQCLLQPTNEHNLNDTLKLILLNMEENLIKNKDEDAEVVQGMLSQIHSNSTSTLSKVLNIIKFENLHHSALISDDNRLSLLCSIILHHFSIGNYNYARSLIKYLKTDKSRKFMSSNSITLMALIATIRTLIVALDHKDLQNDIDDFNDVDSELDDISELNELITFKTSKQFNNDDDQTLQDLLCGLRLYVGQGCRGDLETTENMDYDILNLHYGLQSNLSHRLLELAKEIAGY